MRATVGRYSALLLAAGALVLGFAGCGGGSSSNTSGQVSRATRDRVQLFQVNNIRLLARNGGQPLSIAAARNGLFVNGAVALASASVGGAGASAVAESAPLPMIGAFIQNVAAVSRPNRAAARRAASRVEPDDPNFYFDEFLGLWVQFSDTPTQTTYLLFADQARTQPAGSIVTTYPAPEADPQVFSSNYEFTAGLLAGSHGSYKTTIFSNGSGGTTYEDSSPEGWSGSGESSWRPNGDYTWTSHSTVPGGLTTNDRGTFHADGSGFTHSDASDGYSADFTYRADGSGFGRVNGPAPGLPATIVWDALGNTTITYADGTVDRFNAWGFGIAGGGGVAGSTGSGVAAAASTSN